MSIHSGMREVAGKRNMKGVSSKIEDAFGELVVDVAFCTAPEMIPTPK